MSIKQRRKIANYLDVAETGASTATFALMGAGFKSLEENPSAQTKSRKYVCDKSATQTVNGYNWSTPFEIDQIRDQDAIEFICKIGEQQLTGADVERDYVIVDLDSAVTGSENTYNARKIKVAIELAAFSNDDGDLGGTGNLLGIGDIVLGTFNTSTKTFTAAS